MIPQNVMKKFDEYCIKNGIAGKEKEQKLKKLEEVMNRYLYEPGEAIGIIAAQSLSEPATQMSLDHNEKVIVKRDGMIKIVPIGDFVDGIVNLLGFRAEGWDVYDMSTEEIYVPSITQSEKIEWNRIAAVSRHEAPESLIKISTRSGRKITATDSHSFVVRKDNKVVPVAGSSLRTGDRIPSMKLLPENCISCIETKALLTGEENSVSAARKELPASFVLDKTLGWIFGAYLAEGNSTRFYTSFSNVDSEFQRRVREFAASLHFTLNVYDNDNGYALGHDMRINSTLLSLVFRKTCGTGSENKKVPYFAYSAEAGFVAGLLSGYFDGDGSVSVEREVIRASSSSRELRDGIALLLARFGIFSRKSDGKQFNLSIPHKYAQIFRDKIGFAVKPKADKLARICKANSQDFIDMFSGFGGVFKAAAEKTGYPTRYVNNFTNRQKIGRSAVAKYAALFENRAKTAGVDLTEELSIMRQMLNSDVVWDEITSIETVKPSSKYVYDFTVPGTETFATFDGVITHNTMRSYTLASQSDRLSKVTQGLPRLIEIFDARKTFEKNMTIYLKPSHNTKEKAKEIAGEIKEMKVADVIKSDSIDLIDMKIELELEDASYRDEVKKVVEKYMKGSEVTSRDNKVYVKPKEDDQKDLRKIRNKILLFHVAGIKGITNVLVVKEGEDWIVQTVGSNLEKVFKIDASGRSAS